MTKQAYKLFLIILLYMNGITSTCAEGCLKCNQNNQCILCDYTKAYQLIDNTCKKSEVANCEVFSTQGYCLTCLPNYYLVQGDSNNCLQVTTQLSNCQYYSSASTCVACKQGYFIQANECQPVTTTISNCVEYQSDSVCVRCNTGYLIDVEGKNCRSITGVANCQRHSNIRCLACDSTTFFQDNYIWHNLKFFMTEDPTGSFSFNAYQIKKRALENKCRRIQVENCKELDTFYKCKVCNPGYYLKSGICIKNPVEIIPNCEVYLYADSCLKCSNGYLKAGPKQCSPIEPIYQCEIYDGTSSTTICKECNEFFYLKDFNFCDQRRNEIENCKINHVNIDGCKLCDVGLIPTTDYLKCLPLISNCQSYLASNYLNQSLKCKQCVDEFYTSEGITCEKGGIAFCLEYGNDQFNCRKCANKYYLDAENLCKPHQETLHCKTYHPFFPNICTQCDGLSFLFDVQAICEQIQVENCSEFLSPTSCKVCNDSFHLQESSSGQYFCEALDDNALPNCLSASLGVCLKCKPNFNLILGQCKSPFEALLDKCQESNLDGTTGENQFQCLKCQQGTVPFNHKNLFLCVNNSRIEEITGISQTNSNCLQYYEQSRGVFKCTKCATDYVLQDDGVCSQAANACDINTDNFYHQYVRENEGEVQFYWRDYCKPKTDNVCYSFGISNQNNQISQVNYACTQCRNVNATNVLKTVKLDEQESALITGNGPEFSNEQQSYWKTKFQCEVQDGNNDVTLKGSYDANCEYYYKLHLNQFGCLRCKAGYKGNSIGWSIDKCKSYDDLKNCLKCIPSYYLENGVCNFKDTSLNSVTPSFLYNCDQYSFDQDRCYKCKNTHWLDIKDDGTTVCTQRGQYPISNCKYYSSVQDKCIQCEVNRTLLLNGQNQQVCQLNSNNCLVMQNEFQCGTCVQSYYLQGNDCLQSQNTNCYLWQTNSNTCLRYKKIPFIKNYQCSAATLLENCLTYDNTTGVCTGCVADTHYLYTSSTNVLSCVQYNYKPGETTEDVNNCKFYSNNAGNDVCQECKMGYHFESNNANDQICVQNNYFYVFFNNANKTTQEVSYEYISTDNTVTLLANAAIYDFKRKEPVVCDAGSYFYKGNCCLDGNYGDDCTTAITLPDCLQMQYISQTDSTACLTCTNAKILTNGNCCSTGEFWSVQDSECRAVLANCKVGQYNEEFQYCYECDDGFYRHVEYNHCITENQYWNGTVKQSIGSNLLTVDGEDRLHCAIFITSLGKCLKCQDEHILDIQKQICVPITEKILHCKVIDQKTKNCTTCVNGYSLYRGICCIYDATTAQKFDEIDQACKNVGTTVQHCIQYSIATDVCEICADGYYLKTSTTCISYDIVDNTNSISLNTYINKCAIFGIGLSDPTNFSYECQICHYDSDGSVNYIPNSSNFCCPKGHYFTNNACTPFATLSTNCLISLDDSTCTLCKEQYMVITAVAADICTKIDNSINPEFTTSPTCQFPYFFDATVGIAAGAATGSCVKNDENSLQGFAQNVWCQKLADATAAEVCPACITSHVKSSTETDSPCVPSGFYWSTMQQLPISLPNCQFISADINECNTCQIKEKLKIRSDEYVRLAPGRYAVYDSSILGASARYQQITSVITQELYLSNNHCCQTGYYYNSSLQQCVENPIENCQVYNDSTDTCTTCKTNFVDVTLNDKKVCCPENKYDSYLQQCNEQICDETSHYFSNGHCCENRKYWNNQTGECLDIFVSNCLYSSNALTCEVCDGPSNYLLDSHASYLIDYFYSLGASAYTGFNYKHQMNYCMEYDNLDQTRNYISRWELRNLVNNCKDFRNKTECQICKDDYYLTVHNVCCPVGKTSRKIDDSYKCVEIDKLVQNCFDFNWETQTCIRCNLDPQSNTNLYHEQAGFCCPKNFYFNFETMECDINNQNLNCSNFDVQTGNCLECNADHYLSKGNCCAEGTYFKTNSCQAMDITPAQDHCLIWLDAQICVKCKAQNNGIDLYIHRGRCVEVEKYVDRNWEIKTINDSDDTNDFLFTGITTATAPVQKFYPGGYADCSKLDDSFYCIECKSGSSIQNGRCCPNGFILNITADPKYTCNDYTSTGEQVDKCLVFEGIPDSILYPEENADNIADTIDYSCKSCRTNYYLTGDKVCCSPYSLSMPTGAVTTYKTNDLYECIDTQGIQGCLYLQGDSTDNCNICKKGHYKLLSGGNHSCPVDDLPVEAKSNLCDIWFKNGSQQLSCKICKDGSKFKSLTINSVTYFICDPTLKLQFCDIFDNENDDCFKCQVGYKWVSGTSTCDLITTPIPNNCTSSNTTKCISCKNDFVYDVKSNKCLPRGEQLKAANCIQGEYNAAGEFKCLKCWSSYKLNTGTGACAALTTGITTSFYCLSKEDDDCVGSFTNFYQDANTTPDDVAVPENFNYNTVDNKIKETFQFRIEGCEQYGVKTQCKVCSAGYNLSNDHCCRDGYWFNNSACVSYASIVPTLRCKKFINGSLCANEGCLDNQYVSNQKCCPDNKYFDKTKNACVDIPVKAQPCKKQNEEKCLECVNSTLNYVSNGVCVRNNYYWDEEYLMEIDSNSTYSKFPKCKQVNNNECQICQVVKGNDSFSSSKCCTDVNSSSQTYRQYYDFTNKICVDLPKALCKSFNYTTSTCTECPIDPNTYLIDQTKCCQLGYYWKDTQCILINTLDERLYPFKNYCQELKTEDLLKFRCSGCRDGGVKRGNLCCQPTSTEVNLFDVGDKCVQTSLMSNCQKLGQGGTCTECKSGYVLTGTVRKVCCINGTYYNPTTGICTTNPTTIQQCKIYEDSQNCSVCNVNYYLSSNKKKCCPVGTYFDGANCAAEVTVKNCIEFESANVCKTCLNAHYLINTKVKTHCCPINEYYDEMNQLCLPLVSFTTDCVQMSDIRQENEYLKCKECSDGNYLSNNHCCADNSYWNVTSKSCVVTGNDCAQIDQGKCIKCKVDGTHYITNGMCCLFDKYFNGTSCVAGSQDTKCKKYQDCDGTNCTDNQKGTLCSVCKDNFNLYDKKYCCANLSYWNANTSTCLVYNEANRGVNYHPALSTCWYFTNDFKCQKCKQTTIQTKMSKYTDACCKDNEFVLTVDGKKSCATKTLIPAGCKIYREQILECEECMDNYYFSIDPSTHHQKHCCQFGNYYDVESDMCKTLSDFPGITFQTQCNQINVSTKQCTNCIEGWVLNSSKMCIQVPSGCDKAQFNKQTNICYGCVDQHYLTNGVCCPHGKFYRMGMCIEIDSNLGTVGCLQAEQDKCLSCLTGKYLTHNTCCNETQYFQLDSNDQNIKNCKDRIQGNHCAQFGFYNHECLKCDNGFVLSMLEDEYYDCIEITDKGNCKSFTLTENNNTSQNVLGCSACDVTTQPTNAPYLLTTVADVQYDQSWPLQNCTNQDIHSLLSNSSKKCLDEITTTCSLTQFINDLGICENIPIENCISYDKVLKVCNECETGYHLNNWEYKFIHRTSCIQINTTQFIHAPSDTLGYVPSCSADTNLSQDAVQNLPTQLDKYFNVHKCSVVGKIPFAFVSAGGQTTFPKGISRYNLKAALNEPFNTRGEIPEDDSSSFSTSDSNLCMTPELDLVENKPQEGNLIENCAMAMINTDKQLSFFHNNEEISDLSQLSVFCVACNHGFKPMINPRLPLHVYECVRIDNCNTTNSQNFVNGCISCNEDYSFGFKEGVDYTQCLASVDENNCLSVDSLGQCHYCEEGFSLNHLNKCEKLSSFQCNDTSVSTYRSYSINDIAFVHRHYSSTPGCQQCASGYTGLFIDYNLFVCQTSSMLSNSQNYDKNCDRFGVLNDKVVCSQCQESYVKDTSGVCLQTSTSSALINCLLAEKNGTTYKCLTCATDFINVAYSCQTPSISSCVDYSKEILQQQVCIKCEDGFYVSNNQCLQGTTLNCKNYTPTGVCTQCNSGFALTNLKDGQIVCVKVNLDDNCSEYSNNQFQDRNVSCTKCNTGYLLEIFEQPKTTCSSFPEIANCVSYDKADSLENSSLKCLLCADSFYLENNICKDRTIIQNCQTYELLANKCKQCGTQHYLNSSQTLCLSVPSGILNCLEYLDASICRQCKQNYYLFDNQCLIVEQPIKNCQFYADSVTCVQCLSGFFLRENLCREQTVTCSTYAKEDECLSCPSGQIIFIELGKRICKTFTAITQCAVHNHIEPVKCLQCNNNYYLDQEECKPVNSTDLIEGCIKYQNSNTCAICQSNRALSLDKKKCVIKTFTNPSTNCVQLEENNPFCTYCEAGYTLNENGACEVDQNHIEGCMTVNEDGQTCDLCLPNFYMNSSFNCVAF